MRFKQVYILVLFALAVTQVTNGHIVLEESLKNFLGTLETYTMTPNDVVFLLDESGSISAPKFLEVKLFTKLTAQRLSVSPEHSRIAVVTFATDTITHINHIRDPDGNNMCTLLADIDKIGYVGEWTHTDKAMIEARNIFAQARPSANKIIILMSDGQSNDGHSPLTISEELKSSGVIIFAVGVAEVNNEEIYAVASTPDHVYILKDFANITQLNKQLIGDTKDLSMDLAKHPSYCNSICDDKVDCCDEHANCYCGTITGNYECACIAGYHGKGHKGECHKCPKGTYKREALNSICTACPEHSTTLKEGSTSFEDCQCERGYEKHGNFCVAVKCASLSAPSGGFLIPSHCNNTYGSQCSFKCRAGFCPFSCSANNYLHHADQQSGIATLPTRTCLENGKWTGEEFYCESISCPALHSPFNGNHNCSKNDFTYGSTCHFTCNKGFELSGAESRTCLLNSSWTGIDVNCKEIYCERVKTNKYLHVKPEACSTKSMPYRSVCQYICQKEFTLVSTVGSNTTGTLKCEANKKWSGGYNQVSCKDVTPPKITCPKSIVVDQLPHRGYAEISWDLPKVKDNNYISENDVRIIEPKGVKKPPFNFFIGKTKVVYEATDSANLSKTCSFTITVLDKEPPQVISCPTDIEIYHDKYTPLPVVWKDPQFEDNSKKVSIELLGRKSGDTFAWGNASSVSYIAKDESGNVAYCNFTVKIKPYACPYYKPPANGVLTCDTWLDGRLCSIFCHDGFQLASGRSNYTMYMCNTVKKGGKIVGEWQPFGGPNQKFKMPWPDCSRKQKPTALNFTATMTYNVDSCSEEVLQKMREEFINKIPIKDMFCPKDRGCHPENVNITCRPVNPRAKRNLDFMHRSNNYGRQNNRLIRQSPNQVLTISFNMAMLPNITEINPTISSLDGHTNSDQPLNLDSNPVIKALEDSVSQSVKEAYNLDSIPEPDIHHDITVICTLGQIEVNNTCVNCPAGTYKEQVSGTCMDCPHATYQDEERHLSCKPCPEGYTTYELKSKTIDDCRAPCKPGTYSKTTFEPCLACPLNTYQERSSRKECFKCAQGLYTWRVGSNSSSDCVAPCKAGTFSDTGYEPCNPCTVGSFQDKENQVSCIPCPNRTSTALTGSENIASCKEIDICSEHRPCREGSTCLQIDKDYRCLCPDGLVGKHCEINIDECEYNPCLNNGKCIDGIGNFSCECIDGWSGYQCENNIDDCEKKPCRNEGECIDLLNAYECRCRPGFSGSNCEINVNECHSDPCLNNGICFDMENGYRCCCDKGYYGKNCEKEFVTDFCETVSCRNGGTCFPTSNGFNCSCVSGFDGELCENNTDDCSDFNCFNGGICVDGINSATCICPKEYVGIHCEEGLFPQYALSFPQPPSISNYAEIPNNRLLNAITLSFFMSTQFKDSNNRGTPVSYSYKEKDRVVDNALTLLDTNNFVLYIHGEAFHTEYEANKDTMWHHYAVTWEKVGGKWAFYVDGKVKANGLHVGEEKYMHPGMFILGQEQDNIGDIFSSLEAFSGSITDFNVWDYALSGTEIEKLKGSCGYIGNVIPWYLARTSLHGDVTVHKTVEHCIAIGTCSPDSCDCFYSNKTEENSCKHEVEECSFASCENDQSCYTNIFHSFCNCSSAFEGRRCELDFDECLENNGGCEYFCINEIGSHRCECPEDMILSDDGKKCKETAFCIMDGHVYSDGETWLSNNCLSCLCDRGSVQCKEINCNETSCHAEETMITAPGECCPKCVAWSFCIASLNNTVTTFDMSSYEIDGDCTYTIIEDCIDGRFKIQIESPMNKTTEKNLLIYQDCMKLVINSNGIVLIDDNIIKPPFKNEEVALEEDNATITIKTKSDLLIHWSFANGAVIAVPITDVHRMCGLCSQVELYSHSAGKYSLPERTASGESECFMVVHAANGNRANLISDQTTMPHVLLILSLYMCFYYDFRYIQQ